MDIPVLHERFEGQRLAVRAGVGFHDPQLVLDGAPLTPSDGSGQFVVADRSGTPVSVVLAPTWVDPIPKVYLDGETLELARPLGWLEYLWICLPLVLVIGGGAVGILVGIAAIYSSARIFRGSYGLFGKYGLSTLVSFSAIIIFLVLGGIAEFLIAAH